MDQDNTPQPATQLAPDSSLPNSNSHPTEPVRLNTDPIYVIAQSVPSLPPITQEAAAELAPDAEYRLREIIQESIKFMRHSKRSHLLPSDLNSALRLRNVTPIYGFTNHPRKSPHSALAASASKPPTPTTRKSPHNPAARSNPARSSPPQFTLVDGTEDLFFQEDTEFTVKSLLHSNLPPLPLEVTLNPHWLAVEGSQPAISQNPVKRARLMPPPEEPPKASAPMGAQMKIEVKPPLKHDLSRELQMYYQQVTESIFGNNPVHFEACLESVAQEPGIVQALPYFSRFVAQTVEDNPKNLSVLFSTMRLVSSLLNNDAFHIETYLHQILAPVLSCLVIKRHSADPMDDHWSLRDLAADIVRRICCKYSDRYPSLQPRIVKTLLDPLKKLNMPLTTQYGAIVGLACFGRQVVDAILSTRLRDCASKVKFLLSETKQKQRPSRRLEAAKLFGAMVWAVSVPRVMPRDLFPASDVASPADQHAGTRIEISHERVSELLPNVGSLHSPLKEEFGSKIYPYGHEKPVAKLSVSIRGDTSAAN
eukprot:GFKZ01013958.1.p1 GENE.GFKZ01013958.1~~GFKZ01013958.1.p1  ORF type:complete len:536 (+),score=46.78 GFKZ01013958.1:394-2001(+)